MAQDLSQSCPEPVPSIYCRDGPEWHGVLSRCQEVTIGVLQEYCGKAEMVSEDGATPIGRAEIRLQEAKPFTREVEQREDVIQVGEFAHANGSPDGASGVEHGFGEVVNASSLERALGVQLRDAKAPGQKAGGRAWSRHRLGHTAVTSISMSLSENLQVQLSQRSAGVPAESLGGQCRGLHVKVRVRELRRANYLVSGMRIDRDFSEQWEAMKEVVDEILVMPLDVVEAPCEQGGVSTQLSRCTQHRADMRRRLGEHLVGGCAKF